MYEYLEKAFIKLSLLSCISKNFDPNLNLDFSKYYMYKRRFFFIVLKVINNLFLFLELNLYVRKIYLFNGIKYILSEISEKGFTISTMNHPRSRQHRLVFRKKSSNTLSCFIRLFRLIPLRLIQGLKKIPRGLRFLSCNPSFLSLSLSLSKNNVVSSRQSKALHARTNNSIGPK